MYLRFSDKSRYKDVYLINTSLVDRIYIFFFYFKKAAKTASINSQLPNFTNTLLLFIIERRQNFYPLQRLEWTNTQLQESRKFPGYVFLYILTVFQSNHVSMFSSGTPRGFPQMKKLFCFFTWGKARGVPDEYVLNYITW